MARNSENWDFAGELRKAASEIKTVGPGVGLDAVLDEEPVPLTVFVQDKKFLGNPPLSPEQYDAVRHIERIYYQDMYGKLAEEFETGKTGGRLHIASSDAVWREEKYWSLDLRMINFATMQWGKGCIHPNTDVYDARTGRWSKVSEVGRLTVQGVDAVNLDGSTEHLPGAPALVRGEDRVWAKTDSSPFKRGHGPCVRVTTATGGTIDVYNGHLFVSWQSNELPYKNRYERAKPIWKQAASLEPGDRLATMAKLDCLEPVAQDPREVELVGYWIGDGSMPMPNSSQWAFYIDSSPAAADLRARYTELVESYDDIVAKHETMRSGTTRIRATQPGAGRKLKTPLLDIIRKYGLYGSRAWDKRIPPEFFSLPDDQVGSFLSALWDTDGSLYTTVKGQPRAQYVTTSEGLARDIVRLLLRLGVVGRLTSSIKSYVYKGEKKQGRRAWSVDIQADQHLKRLLTVLRLHGEKELRRVTALEYVAERRQQVMDGDVYWDRVVSVEPIGDHDYWDMHVPGAGTYIAGTSGFINSNSGKDHVCRVASMRIAYLLLCLHSPQIYYGMPEQDTIHLLNVASNSAQAQQAFFTPITRAVKKGWFANRCIARQNLISYQKNIESISGHSDAESQEGLNLLLGIADEIDAFKSKKEMVVRKGASAREPTKSAETILNMMRSSASTRFPEVFKNVRISYPRYLGSTIQRLTHEGREDYQERGRKSRHYVSGPLATWEVNPRVKGREAFDEDYREDPIMARAKYECKPARALNPYFRNVQAVDASFRWVERPPLSVAYIHERAERSDRRVWVPSYSFSEQLFPVRGAIYTMHADMAVSGDRAGIAMAHVVDYNEYETTTEDEDGAPYTVREVRPKVKVDFVVSYSADNSAEPPREIQIRWARQLCFDLIRRGFNIRKFTFDSFQSVDSMQILESRGIETDKISTDLSSEAWRNLRDLMYEGRIEIPRLKPPMNQDERAAPFVLRDELLGLTKLPNGRVDHPADGSKDEADALACVAMTAIQLGGREEGGGERRYYEPDTFTTGTPVELPFDVRGVKSIWTSAYEPDFSL
jgi:intein/homing endonuclease